MNLASNLSGVWQSDRIVLILDLVGIFVFASEGALIAIDSDLDFFGVMVLAFATALAGGIIRDLLIGDIPPLSVRDWRYCATAFVAAGFVFIWHNDVRKVPMTAIITVDALGLSLFAVSGGVKAFDLKINPLLAALMGAITGAGGGTIRDIFLAQVPAVLRVDIYAVAALAGAAVTIIGLKLNASRRLMIPMGIIVCFLLRMISVWQHWNLPRAM